MLLAVSCHVVSFTCDYFFVRAAHCHNIYDESISLSFCYDIMKEGGKGRDM